MRILRNIIIVNELAFGAPLRDRCKTPNDCIPCERGSQLISDNEGVEKCQVCEENHYSDEVDSKECTKCGRTLISGVGSPSSKFCVSKKACNDFVRNLKSYRNFPAIFQKTLDGEGDTTRSCKAHPSTARKIQELQCSVGTVSLTGYLNDAGCTPCDPGYFSDKPGSTSCTPCELGMFVSVRGASACTLCPAGKFAENLASTACEDCPAFFYSGVGQSSCSPCPAYTYSREGWSRCDRCTPGNFLEGNDCVSCDAGTYSTDGSLCLKCSAGSFSAAGSRECKICPAGSYSTEGASQCELCGMGSYSSSGAAMCTECSAGRTSGEGAATCTECPQGSFAATGAITCMKCPEDKMSPVGSTSTDQCVSRFECDSHVARLTRMKRGDDAKAIEEERGSRIGLACKGLREYAFAIAKSLGNVPCLPGTFSKDGLGDDSVCVKCPKAHFASTLGSTVCRPCDAGYFSNVEGAIVCSKCPAGTFSLHEASECSQCPAGKFSSEGAVECSSCPEDHISAPGSRSQEYCVTEPECVQFVASLRMSEDSSIFAALITSRIGVACAKIDSFKDQIDGFRPVELCPAGTISADGRGEESDCIPCAAGTFSPLPGSSSCTQCPAGQVAPIMRSTYCTPCPVGAYYESPGGLWCASCQPGYASSITGAVTCGICPENHYSMMGGVECEVCKSGFVSGEGSPTSDFCVEETDCDFLLIELSVIASHHERFEKRLNEDRKSLSCSRIGKYRNKIDLLMPECPQGTFTASGRGFHCTSCAAGTFTGIVGSKNCEKCPAGSFSSANAFECTKCAVGFYSHGLGSGECLKCPDGLSANFTGSVSCDGCKDRERFDTRSATCKIVTLCPAGSYSATGEFSEEEACISCPTGMVSAEGAKSMAACKFPEKCKAGTFSVTGRIPLNGVCTECGAGSTSEEGATGCTGIPQVQNKSFFTLANVAKVGFPLVGLGSIARHLVRGRQVPAEVNENEVMVKAAKAQAKPSNNILKSVLLVGCVILVLASAAGAYYVFVIRRRREE